MSLLRDGEEMRVQLHLVLYGVGLDRLGPIERHALEGVHGDEDDAGVGVYFVLGIATSDRVKDFVRTRQLVQVAL